ncbi:lantibiotic dehydratase C-terminal domain-containing protein [Streptomyces flavofungini]|uniref:lantibiotic dehydratase C-terminal domain-containing protein n=1 Tax=Streptomyces flavofungini TaxID=68200 RepID=UPI0025B08F0E|nr:lantibiotic dehydratase C-terminal domain-containing protein [Streptomyces flavofungini]WJV48593.1 hypothetical protein QUY26_25605 [Streptomyces flavofungini]
MVDLRDDDRTLRLDLRAALLARLLHRHRQRHPNAELAEAATDAALNWIGHAHEFTVPLTSTRPPQPHPDLTSAPVVTNQMLPNPGDTQQLWIQAKLFIHPHAMDQILTRRLPALLRELDEPGCWFVRYRTERDDQDAERPSRLGAASYGPNGPELAHRLTAQVTAWGADRTTIPHLSLHPITAPDTSLPTGHVINKQHSQVVLTY